MAASHCEFVLALLRLAQAPVIGGRGQPGRLAKSGGERACLAESYGKSDIGHRRSWLCQQRLGAFDAPAGMVAMRRRAEGLLERSTEIVRAQADPLRERGARYRLGPRGH